MADFETRVDKLETKVTTLEQQVNSVLTKLDMFIAESRAARERQDADMREIRQSIADIGKHSRNMSIAVIIGIAAMVIAVLLK